MSTSWLSRCGPGVLACRANVTPSRLPRRKRTRLRPGGAPPASSNNSCGGSRSSTTASVTRPRQRLAGAHVPRHAGPPPRVDLQVRGDERLDGRVRVDARLLSVADVLAAHGPGRVDRLHRRQHLGLLVLQEGRVGSDRRLHRQQADHLQQVVLEDVADRPDPLVEAARGPRRRSTRPSSPARCARSSGSTAARAACWRTGTPAGPRRPPCRGSGRSGRCAPRGRSSAASG